jgi:hypothetical protein
MSVFDFIDTITHLKGLPPTRDIARRALDPALRSSEVYSVLPSC